MQIFGQVWLWSLGSFLLGAVFTWLLLVRPMRKKLMELVEAGPAARTEQQPVMRVAEPVPAAPVGPLTATDRSLDDLFDSQQKKAPPALPPLPPPTPPTPAPALAPLAPLALSPQPSSRPAPLLPPATPMPMPEPTKTRLGPGPSAPPEPPLHDDSDTELSDNPFRRFAESTTVFVPPSNLPVPPDVEPSGEDWFSKEDEDDPHLITDVDADEQVDETGTIFTQHTTPIPADMIRSLDDSQPPAPTEASAELTQTVMPVSRHGIADEQDGQYEQEAEYPPPAQEYEPEQQYQPPAHEYQAGPQEYEQHEQVYPAAQEQYEPAQQHEHSAHEYQQEYPAAPQAYQPAVEQYDDAPRQQEPVSREYEPAVQQYEPAPEYQSVSSAAHAYQPAPETGRSLFEPIVPVAEQEAAEADFVPPGPFGPGSAMPLPGGGSPAPEFNVKASVTALRYCTQDNPQFDRIVAEVWFRSPSDAERVGFRVLS
jgi:hypothetical protein